MYAPKKKRTECAAERACRIPLAGINVPDSIIRILGITDLVALPILDYSSVKKFRKS